MASPPQIVPGQLSEEVLAPIDSAQASTLRYAISMLLRVPAYELVDYLGVIHDGLLQRRSEMPAL